MGCRIFLVAAPREERRGRCKKGGADHDDDGASMVEKRLNTLFPERRWIILWYFSMPHN